MNKEHETKQGCGPSGEEWAGRVSASKSEGEPGGGCRERHIEMKRKKGVLNILTGTLQPSGHGFLSGSWINT